MSVEEKIVWRELSQKGKNVPVLLVDCIGQAFLENCVAKAHGFSFNPTLYRQLDASRWLEEKEYQEWQDSLQENEEKKPGWLYSKILDYERTLSEFRLVSEAVSEEFEVEASASNERLALLFERFFEAGKKTAGTCYDYYFINNFYVDPLFAEIAEKAGVEKQNEILGVLLSADEFSEMLTEKEQLAEIAKALEEGRDVSSELREHEKRFAFLGMYYFEKAPLTAREFFDRAKHLAESGIEAEEEKLARQKNVAEKSRELMETLGLSREGRLRVKTLKKLTFATNCFDESWNYSCFKVLHLLKEIAKRLGISYEHLCQLKGEEILEGLRKNVAEGILAEAASARAEDHVLLMRDGRVTVLTGRELAEYRVREKAFAEKLADVKELKGHCASPGSAKVKPAFCLVPTKCTCLKKARFS